MIKYMASIFIIIFFNACSNTNTDNPTVLRGGTVDHPSILQFDRPYFFSNEFSKSYVKFTVKKYQRIVFSRVTNEKYGSAFGSYGFIGLYNEDMEKISDLCAWGDTWVVGCCSRKGTRDYIFLKEGTYVAEYSFTDNGKATEGTITAHDLGIVNLPEVQNKKSYDKKLYGHKYYRLTIKKDAQINLRGEKENSGNIRTFDAVIYDDDINIYESFDNTKEVNISIPKGQYLFRPTDGRCTITFLK